MIKGRKGEKLSVKLLRTVIAVLIAIALIPACLFAIAIGMGTGAANVDWRTWIAFVTAGFVGPMSLFFAMLQIWPWSEDDLEPTSRRKIFVSVALAVFCYLIAFLVIEA